MILAGGSESMSMIPMIGNKFAPNPWLVEHRPEVYMGMGLTAERLQRMHGITREEQDPFSFRQSSESAAGTGERAFR